jgi:hypothetical protein
LGFAEVYSVLTITQIHRLAIYHNTHINTLVHTIDRQHSSTTLNNHQRSLTTINAHQSPVNTFTMQQNTHHIVHSTPRWQINSIATGRLADRKP